jgi:hypothetical protein
VGGALIDVNPLLLAVQRAYEQAVQRRVLERVVAESTPLEKAGFGAKSPGDRMRSEGLRAFPAFIGTAMG